MTSSQPVATPNALNFTPDNKQCYAYSGVVGVDDTEKNLLEFQTNSEYIEAQIQLGSDSAENEDFEFQIYFNNVVVFAGIFNNQGQHNIGSWPIPLIIPPFTEVKISLDNLADTDTRNWTVGLTGKAYGMADTGYQ